MDKLHIYICENLYPEYQTALRIEEIDDMELHVFSTLCDHKGKKNETKEALSQADPENSVLICSKSCDALKLINKDGIRETITGNYCFSQIKSI